MTKPDALRAALLRQQQSAASQSTKQLTQSSQPPTSTSHTGKRSGDSRQPVQHTHKRRKHSNAASSSSSDTSKQVHDNTPKHTNQPTNKSNDLHQQLSGARFRFLNEQLYTIPSTEAYSMMQDTPSLFNEYHSGYRIQVDQWPNNPLDGYIRRIQSSMRRLVVGDFGCGEARLAAECTLTSKQTSKPQPTAFDPSDESPRQPLKQHTIHSFDLVASPTSLSKVTACNIAHVPLPNSTLDIAVFCLSLMGVDFIEFLREAHRVLKKTTSQLWIAEVKSRFPLLNKRGEISTDEFVNAVEGIGFKLKRINAENKMFITFDFTTLEQPAAGGSSKKKKGQRLASSNGESAPLLKPCLYKKR